MMGNSPEVSNVDGYFSNSTGSSVTGGQFSLFWGGGSGNLEYMWAFGKSGTCDLALNVLKAYGTSPFVAP
jgi:hypothetical protein